MQNRVTHPLQSKNIYREGFKRLTVAFLAWTVFLLFAGTLTRASGFSQSIAWLEHWIISGITLLIVAPLAVTAWRSYTSDRLIYWTVLAAVITSSVQAVSGNISEK